MTEFALRFIAAFCFAGVRDWKRGYAEGAPGQFETPQMRFGLSPILGDGQASGVSEKYASALFRFAGDAGIDSVKLFR